MKKPSIRNNTIANFIGQFYIALIGIVITPLYLSILGSEAYGLVSFFALMQAWLNLLDIGLTPTLGRQAAYARGTANSFEEFTKLLKSFEVIFLLISVATFTVIALNSNLIVDKWLQVETLDLATVRFCIILMGGMIGFRWLAGLYRSGLNGLEDQVWLNLINIVFISLKFVGSYLFIRFVSNDIRYFFSYQLFIGFIEILVFAIRFYSKLPKTYYLYKWLYFDWSTTKSIAPFALSIAYTSGLWILISQTDKLILSNTLTLTNFGYYSLVAILAGSITIVSSPLSTAILPRLTYLYSKKDLVTLFKLYSNGSQIVAVITLSVSLMIASFSEALIYAWTGNVEAAQWGGKVLPWFAVGNGILSISAFQYYLQVTFKQLRLHTIGSTISAIIQVPLIYYFASNYGAYGAGVAWFSFRLFWFFIWTPIVHNKLAPGLHMKWLIRDLVPVIVTATIGFIIINNIVTLPASGNRIFLFLQMILTGLLFLAVNALSSTFIRNKITNFILR